jgi:hypothetical protein
LEQIIRYKCGFSIVFEGVDKVSNKEEMKPKGLSEQIEIIEKNNNPGKPINDYFSRKALLNI